MRRIRRIGLLGSTAFGGSTGATALLTPSPAAASLMTGQGSTAFASQTAFAPQSAPSPAIVSQIGATNASLNPVAVTAQLEAPLPASSTGTLFGLSTTQLLIIGGLLVIGGVILFSSKRRK
jgi:hypothetical protein